MSTVRKATGTDTGTWSELNDRYLDLQLARLRLLLRRRILWLRHRWGDDPLEGYQGMVVSDTRADRALEPDARAARRRFLEEDDAALAVGEELERVREELARHRNRMAEAGVSPAADFLAEAFGLGDFERDAVLLALAPEVDPRFEKLYAYVQDDPGRKHATPHLAVSLLAGASDSNGSADVSPTRARRLLGPTSTLRRYRILELGEAGSPRPVSGTRPLTLDERLVAYLHGTNHLDERAERLLRSVPELPVPPSHRELADRLASEARSALAAGRRPAFALEGRAGSGREALARRVCGLADMGLYRLRTDRLPSEPERRTSALRLLEREAVLLQVAYYVEDEGAVAPEAREGGSRPRDPSPADRLDAMVFLEGRSAGAERTVVSVRVPEPPADERQGLWRRTLGESGDRLYGELGELVQQFRFGPRRVRRVVEEARARARMRGGGDDLAADDLWTASRHRAREGLGGLAREIDPVAEWSDIVLPEDVNDQLREIAHQVEQRHQVYDRWGFRGEISRGLGINALFAGPSGTGKTMAAEVIANHLELDLYRIDLASMVSKYIGETEKNLKKVFDGAERSGAILFFDEADALFGKRTEVSDSHDRYANIEIDYLLQRMEEFRGLAILATNRRSDMDPAFLRRLRFIVPFPRPDGELRRRIWETVFPEETPVADLDYGFLAGLDVTGANIRNIALGAAFLAAGEDEAVRMEHVVHAARREYEKVGKRVGPSEFGEYQDAAR